MKFILMLLLFLITTGQSSSCERTFSPDKESSLNSEFSLKYGQTIEIKEEKLKIKFASVAEDSRCPQGEQCIRAGNGGITLDLSKANNKSTTVTLNTASEPQELIYQELEIKLVDLQPHPKSGVDYKHDDYVALLKISSNKQ